MRRFPAQILRRAVESVAKRYAGWEFGAGFTGYTLVPVQIIEILDTRKGASIKGFDYLSTFAG
jgi:hypothetical protein